MKKALLGVSCACLVIAAAPLEADEMLLSESALDRVTAGALFEISGPFAGTTTVPTVSVPDLFPPAPSQPPPQTNDPRGILSSLIAAILGLR